MIDFKRILRAAQNSLAGIRDAMVHHTAFRQEVAIGIVMIPFAIWLGEDGSQRAILISSLLLVLIVELMNSAIETVVDRVSTENISFLSRPKTLARRLY